MKIPDRRKELEEAIKNSGISKMQAASKAGIAAQTLYNYLAGRHEMSIGTYDQIMSALSEV
ncbi:MAG: helix-turn-helix transcriptional regulator [Gammaproteobacteria bacterium]|nr:helix-turn-helix transcriptional regulator [Gammaproteobacteria bacterium]